MDWKRRFETVTIEKAARETPVARRVAGAVTADRITYVERADVSDIPERSLTVAVQRGKFLRRCPGTPGMLCCNLYVLDLAVGCPYDCSFCFLHAYKNRPGILVWANHTDAVSEIRDVLPQGGHHPLRVTSGEVTDSLALESLTGQAADIVPIIGGLSGIVLELKTKSDVVEPLLGLDHGGNVIVSWSLSPRSVAVAEEKTAPPVEARLAAAEKTVEAGYGAAFHFDPIILVDGWERAYTGLVDEIFDRIPAGAVRWFSLGGFRFPYALKKAIRMRRPRSRIFLSEFMLCSDGKFRYFAPMRAEMYRCIRESIEKRAPGVPVYFCMEAPHIWKKAYGCLPQECAGLDPLFEPYAR